MNVSKEVGIVVIDVDYRLCPGMSGRESSESGLDLLTPITQKMRSARTLRMLGQPSDGFTAMAYC